MDKKRKYSQSEIAITCFIGSVAGMMLYDIFFDEQSWVVEFSTKIALMAACEIIILSLLLLIKRLKKRL